MQSGTMIDYKKNLREDDFELERETARRARESFKFFFNTIFSVSVQIIEGEFVTGLWLDDYCDRLQKYFKTCTLAARKHGKTTVILGFIAWLIFRADIKAKMVNEYLWIMYSDDLACEKIKRLKQYISINPFFAHISDLKPTAETVLEYENNGHIINIQPAGVFTFKRGKHTDGVICDDILRDPQKKLDLIQIEKVTQVFEAEITSLAIEGGFTHVAGTSQDETDIMYKLEKLPGWNWECRPAIIDRKKKIVLWPEKYPFERLIDIELNETGKKNFQREYQLLPFRATEGYFMRGEIENLIDKELENYSIYRVGKDDGFGETFGGVDLGKKRHPSHLCVLEAVEEKEIIYLIQICNLFLDNTDYNDQLKIFGDAIKRFNMTALLWDNTRSEFDGFAERGELPSEMSPVTMTAGGNDQIAADFDKQVGNKTIILLDDARQTRSILSVDGNLKAAESIDGHGDAFWSVGLAIQAYLKNSMKQFH